MAGLGQWRGLFDWSMSYADGTKPTDFSSVEANPEKIKWYITPQNATYAFHNLNSFEFSAGLSVNPENSCDNPANARQSPNMFISMSHRPTGRTAGT